MKKIFIFVAFFFIFVAHLIAQTFVNKSWVKTTGLPDAINWTATAFDSNKNLIFVGNTVASPGNANILITKYQHDGSIAWQRISGGQAGLNDYGVAVIVDNQNNSYVAAAITAPNGLFDFAVLKYDEGGNLQWTATWDGANHLHDIPTAITLDDVGNVIIAGGTTTFTQQLNYAVVKFNATGARLWATTYDHANLYDFPTAIEKASNDNIVVTGASANAPNSWDYATLLVNGMTGQIENVQRVNVPEIGLDQALAVTRDPQNNLFITGYNEKAGNKNIQTVKLNSNFGLEWVKTYDAEGLEDIAQSIGCDAFGNVYVAGHSKTVQEGDAFIVLKYDSQGNEVWKQSYKPHTYDGAQAADLKVMPTGEFYLSGTIQKGTEKDFATLKYNKEGQIEWEKRFDGLGTDEVTAMDADPFGNVYVSGISEDANGKKYSTVKYTCEKNVRNAIYALNGEPSHWADELIVKFAPPVVKPEFVNDEEITYGNATDVLTDFAINRLESVLPFQVREGSEIIFKKIFHHLKTTDTVFTSNLGNRVTIPPLWSAILMRFPEGTNIENIKNQLATLFPVVEYSEFNKLGTLNSIPNDSLLLHQSSLVPNRFLPNAHINADSAWNITTGKSYIRVGVFDGAIYWKHPDFGGSNFRNSVIKGGTNFINSQPIFSTNIPTGRHGTAVAGIIGALRNNKQGIAGIAGGNTDIAVRDTGVSLYSFGIVDYDTAFISMDRIGDAIIDGVLLDSLHIQNHSWGTKRESIFVKDALRTAFMNNSICVAARGNDGVKTLSYPACYNDDWVINVGASGNDGTFKTRYNGATNYQSDYGGNVDIIAPGDEDNVFTTLVATLPPYCPSDTLYTCFAGTSSATPHVSGSIGLLLSRHNIRQGYSNNLATEDVEFVLQKYATDVIGTATIDTANSSGIFSPTRVNYPAGYDIYNGWGRLNIGASLRMINAPKYKIIHPTNAPDTLRKTLIRTNRTIHLTEMINGLWAGDYLANVYQAEEIYNNTFPAHFRILDVWKRLSATKGLANADTIYGEGDPWADFQFSINAARNQLNVKAVSYYFRVQDGARTVWLPTHPDSSKKLKYSIHLEDKNVSSISDIVSNSDNLNVYPNPSNNGFLIKYHLDTTPERLELDVIDAIGRIVYKTKLSINTIDETYFDASNLAAGHYIIRLTTDKNRLFKKIIKL